jgi:putative SOS response-associated peptidase YedK
VANRRLPSSLHVPRVGDFPLPPRDYNVALSTMQPIIRETRDTGKWELVQLRWALYRSHKVTS